MPMNQRKWNLDTLEQFLSITIGPLPLGSCDPKGFFVATLFVER